MSDLAHWYGNDLSVSATGDLLMVDGTTKGQQRVLRRLLTTATQKNQDGTMTIADYIWHVLYGAGVPLYVGRTFDASKIKSIIKSQIFDESVVSKNPAPVITAKPIPNGVNVTIQYVDSLTKQTQILNFDVNQ